MLQTNITKTKNNFHPGTKRQHVACKKSKFHSQSKVKVQLKVHDEFFLLSKRMIQNTGMFALFVLFSPVVLLSRLDAYLDRMSTINK